MLMRDYAERALRADIAGAEMQVGAESATTPLAHNFLATQISAGRTRRRRAWRSSSEALRLKPDDAEAHSNLGTALQLQGRLAEARQHAREAVRLKPNDDRVRFNLGNVLNAAGSMDEAIREFARAVALNPENADAHFNLGVILGPRNGSTRRSPTCGGRSRSTRGTPTRTATSRSRSGSRDGSTRRSPKRQALRLQPDSAEAQQQLNLLLKARPR